MSFLTLVVQTDPNTLLGYLAGANIQSNPSTGDGTGNAVFGYNAALALTTGARNTIVGNGAGISLTTGVDNVLLGNGAGALLSGGAQANVAIGNVGTGGRNAVLQSVAVGAQALAAQNGTLGAQRNTALGASAGASIIQGEYNTVLGYGAGALITSGSKNSILGSYSGNQGGLDIRTLSNYIVLSDGDGNPRLWIDNTGAASIPGGILSPTISGSLTITGGTVTANNPVLQATQTWNNAAVTFTGWRLNITDTASAAGSLLMDLQVGGTSRFSVAKNGSVTLASGGVFAAPQANRMFGSTGSGAAGFGLNGNSLVLMHSNSLSSEGVFFLSASGTATLVTEAANTLAQRSGVNAQTFRLYNTFTDASNYSRLAIIVGSRIDIVPEWAGTGASRNVRLGLGNNGTTYTSFIQGRGVNDIGVSSGGATDNWIFVGTGSFTNDYEVNTDVTIGARIIGAGNLNLGAPHLKLQGGAGTGNGRGAEVYAVGSLSGASGNTTQAIYELFRGYILTANEQMFSFGGKTSSFPALKRRSANLQTVGADDTGTAGFIVGNQALATTATDGFIYVPSCAGVPTGVPTAYTGTIPHVVDTTNKHAYWYIAGAWWRANLV